MVRQNIPISITYNRTLLKVKLIVENTDTLFKANPQFKEIFHTSTPATTKIIIF